MSVITVIGQVCRSAGHCEQRSAAGEIIPNQIPANAYRALQPVNLPVCINHDETWRVGRVEYLERSEATGIIAVASIDADIGDLLSNGPWYLSDSVVARRISPVELTDASISEISLVTRTANLNTRPVCWSRVDLGREGGGQPLGMPLYWRDCWDRAEKAIVNRPYRRSAQHLLIVDRDPLPIAREPVRQRAAPTAPIAPAPSIAGPQIRFRGRLIDAETSGIFLEQMDSGYSVTQSLESAGLIDEWGQPRR